MIFTMKTNSYTQTKEYTTGIISSNLCHTISYKEAKVTDDICYYCNERMKLVYLDEGDEVFVCDCTGFQNAFAQYYPNNYLKIINFDIYKHHCDTQHKLSNLINLNNIFTNASLTKLKENQTETYQTYIDFRRTNTEQFMIIEGSVGVGKTYLLHAIIRDLLYNSKSKKHEKVIDKIVQDYKICYVQEEKFFNALKGNFSTKNPDTVINNLLDNDWIFWDDFGSSTKTIASDWGNTKIYDLFNGILSLNKTKIVISTNLNKNQIKDIVGERIFDRLQLSTTCLVTGESLRIPSIKNRY